MRNAADSGGAAIVLSDVWKVFPPTKDPHPLMRRLARLGGVEIGAPVSDGGGDDDDDDDDDIVEDELVESEEDAEAPGTVAVRAISMRIDPGRYVAIAGPPGAGKSVLLRMISGLAPPSRGRLVIRGRVAPALPSLERAVPSRDDVGTALTTMAMMARLPRRVVKALTPEILELAGLRVADAKLARKLSPMQRQRVLLALMLAVDADVLLVDLPLGEWPDHEVFLERIRERHRNGTTILMTARGVSEVIELVDEVLYLEKGSIASDVPVSDHPAAAAAMPLVSLPLSRDAELYLEMVRVLLGTSRTEHAVASARRDAATRKARVVEWNDVATAAGLDWGEHIGVVARLRREHGIVDGGPIAGAAREELALSDDAALYAEHLRVLLGDDRTLDACSEARAQAPEDAQRVEWSWVARAAGLEWTEQVRIVERLRRMHGVDTSEPVFGARDVRRKLRQQAQDDQA